MFTVKLVQIFPTIWGDPIYKLTNGHKNSDDSPTNRIPSQTRLKTLLRRLHVSRFASTELCRKPSVETVSQT